jgi:hypothetical protein
MENIVGGILDVSVENFLGLLSRRMGFAPSVGAKNWITGSAGTVWRWVANTSTPLTQSGCNGVVPSIYFCKPDCGPTSGSQPDKLTTVVNYHRGSSRRSSSDTAERQRRRIIASSSQ